MQASATLPNATQPLRVLVADDNHDLADTLGLLLGLTIGCEVEVVYDGAQALAQACAIRPDAAIFDLEMPEIGGLDAATGVKNAFPDNPPYLIAMSGNPEALDDAAPSRLAMFDRAFCKPVNFDHLVAALTEIEAGRKGH